VASRALILTAHSAAPQVAAVHVDRVRSNEVLIRTAFAGLCHSDVNALRGGSPYEPPFILGHESAGIVEAVGADVTYVRPGDHVVTTVAIFCGTCAYCSSGRPVLCTRSGLARDPRDTPRTALGGTPIQQFAGLGSFSEQMLVHQNAVVKMPEALPLTHASLLGCAVVTGLGAVLNTARIEVGSTVAVLGCGAVGLSVIQGARVAGASRIIAVDPSPGRLSMATQSGATDLVDAAEADSVAQVLEATEGSGVDYAFEAAGLKKTAEQSFAMLAPGGTAVAVGALWGQKIEVDGSALLLGERRLIGSRTGSARPRHDLPRFARLCLNGQVDLTAFSTSSTTLDDLPELLAHGSTGSLRAMVDFDVQ
jgi:S-(hydroxymethyl)glutathione dehydrogenase/alcohol dehydrogenase